MKLSNSINVCLFVEDAKEYIDVDFIKINIYEDNSPYFTNTSINIECIFNENIFNKALVSLKYENVIHSFDGYINKKDIVSDVILYVSKYHDNNLTKIIELKNVIITSINMEEYSVNMICDYYIRFNDFLEIDDKEYLYNICNLINIDKTYNHIYYLGMPFDHTSTKSIENFNDNYEEDWYDYEEDWDDYNDYKDDINNTKDNEDVFEKSSKLISKIFSSFYK